MYVPQSYNEQQVTDAINVLIQLLKEGNKYYINKNYTGWIRSDDGYRLIEERAINKNDAKAQLDAMVEKYLGEVLNHFNKRTYKKLNDTQTISKLLPNMGEADQDLLNRLITQIDDATETKNTIQNTIKTVIRLYIDKEPINQENYGDDVLIDDLYNNIRAIEENGDDIYENGDFVEETEGFQDAEEDYERRIVIAEDILFLLPDTPEQQAENAAIVGNYTFLFRKIGLFYTEYVDKGKLITSKLDDEWNEPYMTTVFTKLAKYEKRGENEMNEWIRLCRNFLVCFASSTHVQLRALDLSFDQEAGQENAIMEEIKQGNYIIDGMSDVGSEQWRFQVFEKRFQISLENEFMLLKIVCKNTGVTRPNKFTSLKSIFKNREEKVLFARMVGDAYTKRKRTIDLKVQAELQLRTENATFEAIQAYYKRIS
jgi:hypothetical protein